MRPKKSIRFVMDILKVYQMLDNKMRQLSIDVLIFKYYVLRNGIFCAKFAQFHATKYF